MNADNFDPDLLAEAIITYTGKGRERTPGAHPEAVLALVPGVHGEQLLTEVRRIVELSDTVTADWSEAVDDSLFPVFAARMTALYPGLTEPALRALSWRWAFVAFY